LIRRTRRRARRSVPAGLVLAVGALAGIVPAAHASTLSDSGTTLVFTAASGIANTTFFSETAPGTVDVGTYGDPATSAPANCTDISAGATGEEFSCTGVTAVSAATLDQDDTLDAGGLTTIPATLDGGAGDDGVYGGAGDDTLDGGAGDDGVFGGNGNDIGRGGEGDDYVQGDGGSGSGSSNDNLDGGPGRDFVAGGRGDDVITAGDGDDDGAVGGPGNDIVSGGSGNDGFLAGGPGADVVNGDGGDDSLYGGCGGSCGAGTDGNDTLSGGGGDDDLQGEAGNDDLHGDAGFDSVSYGSSGPTATGVPVRATLDDTADDGRQGEESDNVHSDVEDVSVYGSGGAVITGTAATNSLSGGDGNDAIDGGAGNDSLFGNGGDDTIQARDGYADRVSCGAGNDTATVDTLDIVSDNCETVLRADVGNANDVPEDKSPTISWVTPAENAKMSTTGANVLQADAADDKGVSQVIFLAGTRTLCVDTTAPFTCAYNPRDVDLGKVTLTAMAVDAAQQTATALRTVVVGQFSAKSLTATTKPGRDATSPFRFTTSGRLGMPTGVGRSLGCQGKVTIQIKAGRKTVSSRSVNLSKSCTYSSKVRFTLPSRLHPKGLRVFVTFRGNAVLTAMKARTRSVKVG
jgi:Ca2+-binding RTX toxin-like protein